MAIRSFVVVGLLLSTISASANDAIPMPELKPGDSWVVQGTDRLVRSNEERSWKVRREITKIEGDIATWKYEMLPPSKAAVGENQFDVGAQTMLRGLVKGKPEATRFPLSVGNEWKYESEMKYGADIVRHEMTAKVVAWEEIKVPAGTFRALRIEHRGKWSRNTDHAREGIMREVQAPMEMIYWYAPAAKAMVKIQKTQWSAYGGIWGESEEELVEVSLGNR